MIKQNMLKLPQIHTIFSNKSSILLFRKVDHIDEKNK